MSGLTMKEIEDYHRILGLEWGASIQEINQAYKDLVFVWHPDRLPRDNTRLLNKATAMIQAINQARRGLLLWSKGKEPSRVKKETVYDYGDHPFEQDLAGANLIGANLRKQDLSGRNLRNANLSYADLRDSFLPKVILERANLLQANLERANLLQANLERANLEGANLLYVDLSGANLRGANLRGAQMVSGNRLVVKLTGALLVEAILPPEIRYIQKTKFCSR